tara:strand:- start:686 stop:1321 length:636 start_codon:yes stop_codon:yes gene_type:complete
MRNSLIDFLRFIAFILMVIHHLFYFNSKSKFLPNSIELLGSISRTLFILLSGISINYRKTNNKSKKIFFYGLIISILSNLLVNEKEMIFFGVLHFIGFSSLILDNDIKKVILVLISSIIINNFTKNNITNNILHSIFSGKIIGRIPLDTFQILEWLPLFCIGILLGIYIKENNLDYNININKFIEYISKNSLELYMINIIISLIWYKLYVL